MVECFSPEMCVNNSRHPPLLLEFSVKGPAADTGWVLCEKQGPPADTFLEFPKALI